MTDEQMDVRLRRAGQVWRAAEADLADVHPVEPAAVAEVHPRPPARPRRGIGLLVSAALVAAAVVVGGTYLVSGLVAKGPDRNGASAGLTGTVWRFVGYGTARNVQSYATLVITTDGRLVADDECSVLGAKADTQDGRLALTDVHLAHRRCTDSSGPAFLPRGLDVLTSHAPISLDGKDLTIGDRGSAQMHFVVAPGIPAPTTDVPTFLDSHWTLVHVSDAAGHALAVPARADLVIDNGRLVASDGCNTLSARAGQTGQEIAVKNVTSTEIGCPAHGTAARDVIDSVLSSTFEPVVRTAQATIAKRVGTLVYRWVPLDGAATDPANLVGVDWHLASVATTPTTAGSATLRIDAAGRLRGSDGCQQLTGTVVVDHGSMTIAGAPHNPPSSCAKQVRERATTIDSFLQGDVLWSVRDGRLVIGGGGAQALAVVYRSDAAPATSAGALIARRWTLSSWETSTGTSDTSTSSGGPVGTELILTFDGSTARAAVRCGSYRVTAKIGTGRIAFSGRRFDTHSCPFLDPARQADEQHVLRLFEKVLDGTVGWSLRAGKLTLTRDATTLTFTG